MFHHVNVIAVAINTCFNFIHEGFCIQIFQNLPLNGGQLPVERDWPPCMSHKGDLLHVAVGDHQMSSCGDGVIFLLDSFGAFEYELPDVLYKWTFLLRIHGFGLKSWEGRQPPMSKSMLSLLEGKPRLELELHLQPPHFWCQTSHDVNMKAQVGSENGHRWCCLLFLLLLLLFLCWFPDNSRQLCLKGLGNLGPWPIGFTIWIQWPVSAQLRFIRQSARLCGIYVSMRKHSGHFPQLIRCFWLLYPDFSVFIHINYFIIILC